MTGRRPEQGISWSEPVDRRRMQRTRMPAKTADRPCPPAGDVEPVGVRIIAEEPACRNLLDQLAQVADVVDVRGPYPAKSGHRLVRMYATVRVRKTS